ncbi:Proline iminopeptidase PfmaB [Exophiala dermatitidis]
MVGFIEINGARLAYRLVGVENAPLIITLHGGRGFGDHKFDFTAYSPLADAFRVLSFDFRGHGQSSHTRPYTFDQIVQDIEGLRRHFAGPDGRVIICGGSFGGYLAQQYAIKHASHISHLILRGTAPSHHHEERAIKVLEQRLHKAPSLSVDMLRNKIFDRFESDLEFQLVMHAAAPLYSEAFDPDRALRKSLETKFSAEAHNDLYSKSEKFFDYRDSLDKITAKTLVIVGEQDWICPPAESEFIASHIPGARLRVFQNANHNVHLEQNAAVIAEIRRHLKMTS